MHIRGSFMQSLHTPTDLFSKSPVRIVDVTARDGLQNEKTIVPTETKIELIERLVSAGHKDIEVTSLVRPSWIPQLADAEQILHNLPNASDVRFWALIPNRKGMERALNVGIKHVATFMSASQTHNRKNLNRTQLESLENIRIVTEMALDEGATVRAYLSTVFGCPYEGDVSIDTTVELTQKLLDLGISEISLGDTTGMGNPVLVEQVIRALNNAGVDLSKIALHMHDTQGTGLVNVLTGYQMGIRSFDASTAGLGGCPYAPGASGNVATEDLINMFHKMGCQTGVDLVRAAEVGQFLATALDKELPGRFHKYFVGSCDTNTRTTA
jgi:hydroxymethylglutaryl-CoA lyase